MIAITAATAAAIARNGPTASPTAPAISATIVIPALNNIGIFFKNLKTGPITAFTLNIAPATTLKAKPPTFAIKPNAAKKGRILADVFKIV